MKSLAQLTRRKAWLEHQLRLVNQEIEALTPDKPVKPAKRAKK